MLQSVPIAVVDHLRRNKMVVLVRISVPCPHEDRL